MKKLLQFCPLFVIIVLQTLTRKAPRMKTHPISITFEVVDNHPGVGHRRGTVLKETLEFQTENDAIVPGAGKHYVELMKRFNGRSANNYLADHRYEVRYYHAV